MPRDQWKGRLENARAFLRASHELLRLAEAGGSGNPIMTQAIDAAIAYGDAVSIKFGGIQNTKDHHTLGRTLQQVLGRRFPSVQQQRLGQILSDKDEAAYGHHVATIDEASALAKLAERFAEWAEAELVRPG